MFNSIIKGLILSLAFQSNVAFAADTDLQNLTDQFISNAPDG